MHFTVNPVGSSREQSLRRALAPTGIQSAKGSITSPNLDTTRNRTCVMAATAALLRHTAAADRGLYPPWESLPTQVTPRDKQRTKQKKKSHRTHFLLLLWAALVQTVLSLGSEDTEHENTPRHAVSNSTAATLQLGSAGQPAA